MHALLRGALAGTVATLPMSAVMLAAGRLGWMGEQPPESIVRHAAQSVTDRQPSEPAANALASLSHVGFGAAAGGVFALLPRHGAPAARGTALALAVYGASYQGWMPALGILPPASEDRPDRPAVMLLAHVVFGTALGLLDERWRRSDT